MTDVKTTTPEKIKETTPKVETPTKDEVKTKQTAEKTTPAEQKTENPEKPAQKEGESNKNSKTSEQPARKEASSANRKDQNWNASRGNDRNRGKRNDKKGGRGRRPMREEKEKDDIKEVMILLRRVTRVMAGGRRMRFSVAMAVGDNNGRIGFALGKGKDVQIATQKAVRTARKSMFKINIRGTTIPHIVDSKFRASRIRIMPAGPGTGIIAGSAARKILELSGISNIQAKTFGSRNSLNMAYVTIKALQEVSIQEDK